jgi:hypothetical protein
MMPAAQVRRACAVGTISAAIASSGLFAVSRVSADNAEDARAVLKAMSENTDIEVITADLQNIQFDSSSQLHLNRPDTLHACRTRGYTDMELFFDGKTIVVANKRDNLFTQVDAVGSVDQLVEKIRGAIHCKFVITSKAMASGPQYTMLITDWKSDATIPSDAFTYNPAYSAKKVKFDNLSSIDEVPPGVIKGRKQ